MHIKSLLLGGENAVLDFKNTISNAHKIAKTLVAFSNHKGGSLLIGVADDGTVKGVKEEEEEKFMILKAAHQYCKPAIEPTFEEIFVEDKLILKVTIPESELKPHYAADENGKWWAYIRIKDKSVLASKIIVDVLKNSQKQMILSYAEDEKKLFDFLKHHDSISLKQLSKLTRKSYKNCQKILANLILTGILKPHNSEKEEVFKEVD